MQFDEASTIIAEAMARFPTQAWPVVEAASIARLRRETNEANRLAAELRLRFPDNPAGYKTDERVKLSITLPDELEYIGEFGAELVLFLPFCAWLSKAGLLKNRRIRTYRGMRCFYDDLDCLEIVEKDQPRTFVPPQDRPSSWLPVRNEHNFDERERPALHLYPDLRSKFCNLSLAPEIGTAQRPLLIIHNKHDKEW